MNILRRQSRGNRQLDHENRIQTLERRIPVDYPLLGSNALEEITVNLAGEYEFPPVFPSPEPCELPACDPEDWRTVGNYFLLPLGYKGSFEVMMLASVNGGTSLFDPYYEVVDPADQSVTGLAHPEIVIEQWRDDEPLGFANTRSYAAWGENPPPSAGLSQRRFWHHTMAAAISAFNIETDRYAILSLFQVHADLGGNATVAGNLVVKLMPPGQLTAGFGL